MLAFGLSLAVWGAPGSTPRVAELEREAKKLSSQDKFREAADLLKKAIEIAPKPRFYYKLADALERAGETSEALEYYRQYTDFPNTDPVLLAQANRAIERLTKRKNIAVEEGAPIRAPPIEVPPPVPGQWAASIEAAGRRLEAQRALDNWRSSRPKLMLGSGGLALGAVVAGIGWGGLGRDALEKNSAFQKAETWQEKDSLKTEIQQRARLADTCLGVGVVLAVVAVVIFPKSPEPTVPAKEAWELPAPKVSLSVGPGAAALEVRF